jgi:tetratricopeptide (TPR) repeat protein
VQRRFAPVVDETLPGGPAPGKEPQKCPKCGGPIHEEDECPHCGLTLPETDMTKLTDFSGETVPGRPAGAANDDEAFAVGRVVGNRYEILGVIGKGGMGWVYKARDREIDRIVAIKVIKPDLARDETVIARFREEIILARRVTHKNVLRIFDIAEAEGFKFISMPYIEGKDLKAIITEKGKLTTDEALDIAVQVLEALKSAHDVGVVHRDLKPHNILIDADGNACVTDFGIAKSMDAGGLTMTGQIVGTPDYMSPEQAEGRDVDGRSDLYSFGLVLYEMLTGHVPFKADSIITTLMMRLREVADPPSKANPDVPAWVDRLVMKALERDRDDRYASADEILHDIERAHVKRIIRLRGRNLAIAAAGIAVAVLALFYFGLRPRLTFEEVRTFIAVLPFENLTGDAELDWLSSGIPENLTADLAQSRFFRVMSTDRLRHVVSDIGGDPNGYDVGEIIAQIGRATDLDAVAVGSFVKIGDKIRITLKVEDVNSKEMVGSRSVDGTEQELLAMIDNLTRNTKQIFNLSQSDIDRDLDREVGVQRTKSVSAASKYSKGLDLAYSGAYLEAAEAFEGAIGSDQDFAIAYARAADAYMNLGYGDRAEELAAAAVERLVKNMDRVPPSDRTYILATQATVTHNTEQAVESYNDFISEFPHDPEGYYKLALTYIQISEWDLAAENLQEALQIDPKSGSIRYELGRVLIYKNDLGAALVEFDQALAYYRDIGNHEGEARVLNAMAVAHRRKNEIDLAIEYLEASIAIKEELGDRRGIAASLGNLALIYQTAGDVDRALEVLNRSLEIRRDIGDQGGIAHTLNKIGQVYQSYGRYDEALFHFQRSYEIREEIGSKHLMASSLSDMGNIYALMGDYDEAAQMDSMALALRVEIGDEQGEAMSLRNIAEILINRGLHARARANIKKALAIDLKIENERLVARDYQAYGGYYASRGVMDSAEHYLDLALAIQERMGENPSVAVTLSSLGDVYTKTGDYGRALASFDRAYELAIETEEVEIAAGSQIGRAWLLAEIGHDAGRDSVLARLVDFEDEALGAETKCLMRLVRGKKYFSDGDEERAISEVDCVLRGPGKGHAKARLEVTLLTAEAEDKRGNAARARELAQDALAESREYGFADTECECLRVLAVITSAAGDPALALGLCEQAVSRAAGLGISQVGYLLLCGDLKRAQGDAAGSAGYYRQALDEAGQTVDRCPPRLRRYYLRSRDIPGYAQRLVTHLESSGRQAEAERYRAQFGLN